MKGKKERILSIDGNWYLHRAFHTLHSKRPVEESLPYHLLQMICKDAIRTRSQYVLTGFDGPRVFRYKVFENYKGDRNKSRSGDAPVDPDSGIAQGDVYDYLPHIYALLSKVGLVYYQPRAHEADDVNCSVAHAYAKDYDIVLGAQDKDGYQCLKKGVRMFDSSHKNAEGKTAPIYITAADAERIKGVKVSQMVQYQILIGDRGDSIPPIKGMTEAKARAILNKWGTLQNWYAKGTAEDRVFMESQRENMKRNRKLVELSTDCVPPTEVSEWKLPRAKPDDPYLPRSFHDYHAFLYPKSRGLFG